MLQCFYKTGRSATWWHSFVPQSPCDWCSFLSTQVCAAFAVPSPYTATSGSAPQVAASHGLFLNLDAVLLAYLFKFLLLLAHTFSHTAAPPPTTTTTHTAGSCEPWVVPELRCSAAEAVWPLH
jgi:hypothetical protein